jgi:cyclomaltodextrinase / maltogenic alpha-amylase / neopullulanase
MNTDTRRLLPPLSNSRFAAFRRGKCERLSIWNAAAIALTLLLGACATTHLTTTVNEAVPAADRTDCVPSPLGKRPLFLRGAFNNWNALENFRFAYRCNAFELVATINGEHGFKLGDEQWSLDADFGGADNRVGTRRQLALKGANLIHNFNGTHRIRMSVTSNVMAIENCSTPPFGDKTIYLRGSMNNWAALDDFAFKWNCDAYYLNVNLAGMQEFKVADARWGGASSFGGSPKSTDSLSSTALLLARSDDGDGAQNISHMFNGAHTMRLTLENNVPKLSVTTTYFDDPSQQPITDPVALSVKFDSRNASFKQPFGAVTSGTKIDFSIVSAPGIERAALVIEKRRFEGNQEILEYTPLARVPMQRTGDHWRASHTFADVSVYGYYYEIVISDKTFIYGNNRDSVFWTRERGSNGVGEIVEAPDAATGIRRFRQTVFDAHFKVPDYAPDIVYYYIFPDRFRNGNKDNDPKPGVDKYQRHTVELHKNWNEKPFKPKSGDGSDDVYNNDFFGGDLAGITEKLDYIKGLGANTIYMTPIFKAPSNHKYDTADYTQIDPYFGSEADFVKLTDEAKKRDMRVILDTSLNHVGSDSLYFDRYGNYAKTGVGAFANNQVNAKSPYASWFTFDPTKSKPEQQFKGWTGIVDLPEIDKSSSSFRAFAYGNADSVMKRWLDRGAGGWRMDVAPWVPDDFWREWRSAIKAHRPDAITVSEAWFDCSKYLLGDMFDSTMNYIFRNVVQEYAMGGDARKLYGNLELLREAYPPQALYALMNLLSSHDQARALHHFGFRDGASDAAVIALAKQRLRLAVFFQMIYPGAPTIYYGDEVGVTGGDDPYNRATYPWEDTGGKPDSALLADFKRFTKMRNDHAVLRRGSIDAPIYVDSNVIVLLRKLGDTYAITATNNASESRSVTVTLPAVGSRVFVDVLDTAAPVVASARDAQITFTVPSQSGRALVTQ